MLYRERRSWTAHEDQLLREAVELEDPANPNPSKWHAISKHVPNRTNKDCRKRWFAKMASDVVKGGWSPEEDDRLVKAIEKYGTRWSMVASMVQTRNSDQCAKRWTDTLNPTIDRTSWTPEADALLIKAVQEHGKFWTKIVKTYFPGRTGLSAKNRYNSITRFSTDSRVGRRQTPTSPISLRVNHRCDSVSSSSASASPVTPSATVAEIPRSSSLMTPSEYAIDSNAWSNYPSSQPSSIGKTEHFTYEELISALMPLQHEQEELLLHQNLQSEPYINSISTMGPSSSHYNVDGRAHHHQTYPLNMVSSHDSIARADPDRRNDRHLAALRGMAVDRPADSDVYLFNHHHGNRPSVHNIQTSQMLSSPISLHSPASTPVSSNPMMDSPIYLHQPSASHRSPAFYPPNPQGPVWDGDVFGMNANVQSHWLPC
ncbi:hypothetical protein K435DRAFT_839356 [Dendrothele bispora CBS 962.96]|uniref:Homeodomain-like protein n=1 Tax=Dendrothele bispora (strain CBS 962.96) TaxID=1314807 RepID=A0A4S8M0W6_DENBC|nr:hypothetical protein K435DRAFT_839356 [Dendrothele bispora CBS 962.96]